MRWPWKSLFLISLVLLSACAQTHPSINTSAYGYLAIDTWASGTCVKSGDTIKLRSTVTNEGKQTEVIQLTDHPVLDIMIRDRSRNGLSADDKIIHWSDGKTITPDVRRLELKPGESKTLEMDWVVQRPVVALYGVVSVPANLRLHLRRQ